MNSEFADLFNDRMRSKKRLAGANIILAGDEEPGMSRFKTRIKSADSPVDLNSLMDYCVNGYLRPALDRAIAKKAGVSPSMVVGIHPSGIVYEANSRDWSVLGHSEPLRLVVTNVRPQEYRNYDYDDDEDCHYGWRQWRINGDMLRELGIDISRIDEDNPIFFQPGSSVRLFSESCAPNLYLRNPTFEPSWKNCNGVMEFCPLVSWDMKVLVDHPFAEIIDFGGGDPDLDLKDYHDFLKGRAEAERNELASMLDAVAPPTSKKSRRL